MKKQIASIVVCLATFIAFSPAYGDDARAQQIASIRAQIAKEEAKKQERPKGITKQKLIDTQNEKIRLLQIELWKLGVTGASLSR